MPHDIADVRAAVIWARGLLARAEMAERSYLGKRIEYRDTLAIYSIESLCYAHDSLGLALGARLHYKPGKA